jgi:pectin methylesterase-like acyl-CoA thioesterase
MSIQGTFIKQPAEVNSYIMNFTDWLEGDTIDSQTTVFSGSDSALVIDSSAIVVGAKKVKVVLSAGTVGVKYKVTVTAQTAAGGLKKQEEFYIVVKEY